MGPAAGPGPQARNRQPVARTPAGPIQYSRCCYVRRIHHATLAIFTRPLPGGIHGQTCADQHPGDYLVEGAVATGPYLVEGARGRVIRRGVGGPPSPFPYSSGSSAARS